MRAIEVAKENLADGAIAEIPRAAALGRLSFHELAVAGLWNDIVEYRFRCNTCSEVFSLHAETYHGSGGYWEPENRSSVRENL